MQFLWTPKTGKFIMVIYRACFRYSHRRFRKRSCSLGSRFLSHYWYSNSWKSVSEYFLIQFIDRKIFGENTFFESVIKYFRLIRPFREHHIDPTAMLNHDFVETNADTFALTIPFLLVSIFNFYYELKGPENLFWDSWLLSLCVFVSLTNEFHKV